MKRTLERELKVPEVAEREAIETSPVRSGLPAEKWSAWIVSVSDGLGSKRICWCRRFCRVSLSWGEGITTAVRNLRGIPWIEPSP